MAVLTNPNTRCCTPAEAWDWVEILAEMALGGDADAVRILPRALEHYLTSVIKVSP